MMRLGIVILLAAAAAVVAAIVVAAMMFTDRDEVTAPVPVQSDK